MISLPGYILKDKIHSGEKSIICRGTKAGSLRPVVIKILNNEYPGSEELNAFRTEYEVLEKIRGKFIIQAIGLEKYANSLAIIFEDIGAEAVSKLLKEGRLSSLEKKLQIMILTAEGLEEIHSGQAVHKDVKPQNMIFNPDTSEFKFIDFGSLSFISRQSSFVPLNSSLEGTLPYVSPEQTGRMNRSVDYRSDYYSLGITYYQILTGTLPFVYTDPMEMIYAHIARLPAAPYQKNGVPQILSEIVMKLLEKNPEDRYQSAEGLLYDLKKCRDVLAETGEAGLRKLLFHPAENDRSGRFQIPEKLYGREKEIYQIIRQFRKSTEGSAELLLISGRSGIGKSALVNEINKPITEYKGYFASGKYDQYKRSIPYWAFSQVFQSLIGQILTGSPESVEDWRDRLGRALTHNGKIITDVIPELENLIGEQPDVPDLPPAESENRFNSVFQNFIKAFCTEKNPVSIFLDDMQWADMPSLKMIQNLFSDKDIKYFFLMMSFRDNEVLPSDPFSVMIEDLKKNGSSIGSIQLEPLILDDVRILVEDTLGQKENVREIAAVLTDKTKGNPFFVNELFRSLYERDLIFFRSGRWNWDSAKIHTVHISENVIDLMIAKIQELPDTQIRILKIAACVGDSFSADVLSEILSLNSDSLKEYITELSNDGFFSVGGNTARFVHDKIREAVYTLISEEERSINHYNIGNTYLRMVSDSEADEMLFTILSQLNQGASYVKTPDEIQKLLILNITAGKKSLASAAYEAGLNFFRTAEKYISSDIWSKDYSFSLDFYVSLAKAEYLSRQYEDAEKTFRSVLRNAVNINDKIPIYEMMSSMYVSQNRILEALEILKQALKSLGMRLPKNPSELSPLPEIIKFKLQFRKKKINDLEKLPLMDDESAVAVMHLLNAGIAPSFISQPNLFPVIVMKMANLSLNKGNYYLSPFAYCAFGLIQGSGLGDFAAGYDFGKMSLALLGVIGGKTSMIACRTNFLFATMISHWRDHAKAGRSFFHESIQSGQMSGDFLYASYSVNHLNFQNLLMRSNLSDVLNGFQKYDSVMLRLNQYDSHLMYKMNEQFTKNLSGLNGDILELKGDRFNEENVLPELIQAKNSSVLYVYYLNKAVLQFLFGEMEKAVFYSSEAKLYEGGVFGMMFIPEQVFFDSLISFRMIQKMNRSSSGTRQYLKRIKKNAARIKKWAENCEANYGHKYYIISGLIFETDGREAQAAECYQKAVRLAADNEYFLEEALANEFLADYWNRQNREGYLKYHITEAHYAYKKWGCVSKMERLEKQYPFLRNKTQISSVSDTETFSSSSSAKITSSSDFLDLSTVIKASQAISGEIQLGRLLERMMRILIENAGAERGFFILKKKENWYIEAEGTADKDEIRILHSIPLDGSESLSVRIVHYVIRTKTVLLLHNAEKKGLFSGDEYIKKGKIKSVLCYPIINQRNLRGIVYLENNLTSDAFTPDRVEILKLLAAQIAVSVENSLLYANLEEKVEERTRDLNSALTEVSVLKIQQDGDYFLNTLLIEPLGQNNAVSKTVQIDFFLRQKKKFIFRKETYELGGDINISDNIKLNNIEYIVFLNGDAMGKSIQGAGGVLVLGTVFKSILQRTNDMESIRSMYPERWIKNAFVEMHKVFESFEGTMLMSLVFGLIDENTGTMYYINAEHPDPVLYRDSRAEFIQNPAGVFRKLGTQGKQNSRLQVSVFRLRPQDKVIIGSDGRDDFVISRDEVTGQDVINQDELLFLRSVEAGQGSLEKIYNDVVSHGQQFDDFSLLSITYQGAGIQESYETDTARIKELISAEDYKAASSEVELLIKKFPEYTEVFLLGAKIYLGLKNFDSAVDLAERARLRDIKNLQAYEILLDSYTALGRNDRVKELVVSINKLFPNSNKFQNFSEGK